MKATPKPECVGEQHPVHGVLVSGQVYEVETIHPDGPFEPVKDARKKKGEKEAADGLDG